ncbi:hypothetical protein BH11PSE9_BH11PSE9_09630 [soil metagenome]
MLAPPFLIALALLLLAVGAFGLYRLDRARQASAQRLRASEERYRSMVEALNEGVLIFDHAGRVQGGNAAAERLLDRSLEDIQSGALDQWRPITPDGHTLGTEELPVTRALRDGVSTRNLTLGIVRPSGDVTWIVVNTVPLYEFSPELAASAAGRKPAAATPTALPDALLGEAVGKRRGAVASFSDITERRRVEQALAVSEETNRSLMNAFADGVFVAQDYRFVFANPALPRMLGYGPGEFIDIPFDRVVAPETLPVWNQRFAQRVGTGAEPARAYEVRFLMKGGTGSVELELVATRASYLGRPAVLGVLRDIAERKKTAAELELHRSHLEELVEARTRELRAALVGQAETEHFAQMITDNQPTLLAYIDRELVLRFANRAYLDWFGLARAAVIDRHIHDVFTHDIVPRQPELIARVMAGEAIEGPFDRRGAQGSVGHFLVYRLPDWHEGQVRGYFFIATDVTRQRQAEQRLQELNNALQQLNEDLVQARDRAEAAARAKGAFLANMSHEIRTPMNAIIGLTHLMRRDQPAGIHSDRLGRVDDAARHLLTIINDILDLSKIESGKLQLEEADFSLDTLLGSACDLVAEAARAKGLELVIDTDDVPRMLRGDATRLSQALVNLLGNAVKFTERGTVLLVATLLQRDGAELHLRFEVRDTGPGIAADRLPQLFQAFEQADTSTTRRFGGTGLGLAITRHLAQAMGGDAGAQSVPGEGSTFWITVRLQAVASAGEAGRQTALSGLHALLVDDVADARVAMTHMLRQLGLRTDTAVSGAEALAMARAAERAGDAYDVVLVDWLMPHMDGSETVRRLLAQASGAAPACMLVSVSTDERMRQQALALGVTCLLQKPVSYSTLHDHLISLMVEREPPQDRAPLDLLSENTLRAEHLGAPVLLAEDNPVNQEVATTLLRLAGLEVDVARTGAEAVAMATTKPYALILMDMQMPELDGIEATRRLRTQARTATTPIIAMTANAYLEDREACMAAGMNDYITKPVDPPLLYDKLARWLRIATPQRPPAGHTASTAGDNGAATASAAGLARIEGLDTASGQAFFAGDAAFYRIGLQQFATLYGEGIAPITAHLAGTAPLPAEALRRELHSFGGACGSIGATRLADSAAQLSAGLRDGAGDAQITHDLAALCGELAALVQVLRGHLAPASPVPAEPNPPSVQSPPGRH